MDAVRSIEIINVKQSGVSKNHNKKAANSTAAICFPHLKEYKAATYAR